MSGRNYDDIIALPHHRSATRQPMSAYDRAAQFSPFAALKGYDEEIDEAARTTEEREEPAEDRAAEINRQLVRIREAPAGTVHVCVTYFVKDEKKRGGRTCRVEGSATKLDLFRRILTLDGGVSVPIDDIIAIE